MSDKNIIVSTSNSLALDLSDNLLHALEMFNTSNLTNKISEIESKAKLITSDTCVQFLNDFGANEDALLAAGGLKKIASQINVTIHALGILRCLPHILESNEEVLSLSLGAGNAGKKFDLETTLRIAEFKFIHWKGGSEAIRQDGIFKDFYYLAEFDTEKKKQLYLMGTKHALRFFNGRRAVSSVLNKNKKLHDAFQLRYGSQFKRVGDYYAYRKDGVGVCDISAYLPELTKA